MSWISIRQYADQFHVSFSTVRRHIQLGKVQAKKMGRNWYVFANVPENLDPKPQFESATLATEPFTEPMDMGYRGQDGNLQSVIEFSSKALHHYLLINEKLVAEKDMRLKEKEGELIEKKQALAELQSYTDLLEVELDRLKNKPEGWA